MLPFNKQCFIVLHSIVCPYSIERSFVMSPTRYKDLLCLVPVFFLATGRTSGLAVARGRLRGLHGRATALPSYRLSAGPRQLALLWSPLNERTAPSGSPKTGRWTTKHNNKTTERERDLGSEGGGGGGGRDCVKAAPSKRAVVAGVS